LKIRLALQLSEHSASRIRKAEHRLLSILNT